MTKRTAALRYARALFDVAQQEKADLSEVETQIAAFADLLIRFPQLQKVLLNPAVPVARKSATVGEITKRVSLLPIVSKLVSLLAERDRLILLPDLVTAFRDRLAEHRQIIRAELSAPLEFSTERAEEVRARLSKVTGRTVTITTRVDPALVGGLVARVGGTVYDASLATQLKKLTQSLRG